MTEVLLKIHEDLELLKRDIAEIKEAIHLDPELKKEIKQRVAEARERIAKGQFITHEQMLNEFDLG
jgi:hypothetical protein